MSKNTTSTDSKTTAEPPSNPDKHFVHLRKICHEVATKGPKNWRPGLLDELRAALSRIEQ